jgi:hypothetical protein
MSMSFRSTPSALKTTAPMQVPVGDNSTDDTTTAALVELADRRSEFEFDEG